MITHSTTYHPFYSSFATRSQWSGICNAFKLRFHPHIYSRPKIRSPPQPSIVPRHGSVEISPSTFHRPPYMEALKSALQKSLQTLNAPSIASADGHLPGEAKE